MPNRIPVSSLSALAKQLGLTHTILLAYDGERQHVVTYGTTQEFCAQAAQAGNRIKAVIGWEEHLQADPTPIKKLKEQVRQLESQVNDFKDANRELWDKLQQAHADIPVKSQVADILLEEMTKIRNLDYSFDNAHEAGSVAYQALERVKNLLNQSENQLQTK